MISHLQTILAKDPFYVKETRFVDISLFVQLARKYLKAHVTTQGCADELSIGGTFQCYLFIQDSFKNK